MKYKNIFLFIFVVTLSLTLLQLFIRIEINQIAITTKSVDREIFYAERTLLIKELEYQDAYSPKRLYDLSIQYGFLRVDKITENDSFLIPYKLNNLEEERTEIFGYTR